MVEEGRGERPGVGFSLAEGCDRFVEGELPFLLVGPDGLVFVVV